MDNKLQYSEYSNQNTTFLTRMIKVVKALAFALIVIVITGCSDFFETYPTDELLEKDFWKTTGDVESSLITCYYDLRRCQDELILYGLGRSDIVSPNPTEIRNIQKGIFTTNYKICDWSRWYRLINDANLVLVKSPEVMKLDPAFTQQKHDELMAEARFLRAFSYFNLIRMWKNIPLVTEPSLHDAQDFFPFNNLERDSIFSFIENDLKYAAKHIPDKHTVTGDKEMTNLATRARATKGAVWALLSEVYLWQDKYQECINACDTVLKSNLYRMMPNEGWWNIFNYQTGNSEEAIWELNYDNNFNYTFRDASSRYGFSLEEWFTTQLKAQTVLSAMWPLPDVRYYTLMGSAGNLSRKNIGATETGNSVITTADNPNWIIYRLPYIIFNKAEALNRLKGSTALDEINSLIRSIELRAGVMDYEPITGGTVDVEEKIMYYKLKETAFEGLRWFDLVRVGRRQWNDNLTGSDNFLVRSIVDMMPIVDQVFVKGNLNDIESWYLPILEDELLRNPNLVQNPYYSNL